MFTKPTKVALACAATIATIASTQAQTSSELGAVVITASRTEKRVGDLIGNNLILITSDDIRKSGASTLGEVLNMQPGIQFDRDGGPGAPESVFIRGGNSSHTLLLIDGVRANSATTGAGAFQAIPLSLIERVEILSGAQSALYGADAVSGVINVITKKSDVDHYYLDAGFGNLGSQDIKFGLAKKIERTTFLVDLSDKKFSGINQHTLDTNGYNSDRDGYSLKTLNAKAIYAIDRGEVGVSFMDSKLNSQFDSFAYGSSAPYYYSSEVDWRNKQEIKSSSTWIDKRFSDLIKTKLSFADYSDQVVTTPSSTYPNSHDLFKTRNRQINLQNDISFGTWSSIFGLENLNQSLDTTGAYSKKERSINSQYLGVMHSQSGHQFQANLRRDDNDQFGEKLTHSLAYAYRMTASTKLSVSKGTAYKAPSFNDLYFPYTPGSGGGDANLKPETAKNYELGISYKEVDRSLSITKFISKVNNLIQWTETDPINHPWEYFPANVGEAKVDGYELKAMYRVLQVEMGLNYTHQNAKNLITNTYLVRRSKNYGLGYVGFGNSVYRLRAELMLRGNAYDDADNARVVSGYGLVNLYGERKIDKSLISYVKVNNLFDKNYTVQKTSTTTSNGLPMTLFVGVRYQYY
jgi:vitamin B12 transporter